MLYGFNEIGEVARELRGLTESDRERETNWSDFDYLKYIIYIENCFIMSLNFGINIKSQ